MTQTKSLQMYIRSEAAMTTIQKTLGDRAQDFASSLLSLANQNAMLQNCDHGDVIKAAMQAASMRLPIDPNLGFAYIIPYKNFKQSKQAGYDVYDVQFQVGYKGFIQLALRSGEIERLNVREVRDGEFKGEDFVSGEMTFDMIQDPIARAKAPVVGYLSYLRLAGGFEKMLYMTDAELKAHAKKFSQTYKLGYGKWVDDFDAMSKKTVVKLLISRWAPQSTTQLQKALRADQAAMKGEDDYNYLDNRPDAIEETSDKVQDAEVVVDEDAENHESESVDTTAPESKEDGAVSKPVEEPEETAPLQKTLKEKIAARKAAKGTSNES